VHTARATRPQPARLVYKPHLSFRMPQHHTSFSLVLSSLMVVIDDQFFQDELVSSRTTGTHPSERGKPLASFPFEPLRSQQTLCCFVHQQ